MSSCRRTITGAIAVGNRSSNREFLSICHDGLMETIGARVRMLRMSKNLSQNRLAELCGVSQPTIANIERGRTTEVKGYVLSALARVLISTEQFILHGVDGDDGHEADLMLAELSAIWRMQPLADKHALTRAARGMVATLGQASPVDPFPSAKAGEPKAPTR